MVFNKITSKLINISKSLFFRPTSWNSKPQGKKGRIIIYQYGKVGSASMYKSLNKLNLRTDIHHIHFLNDFDNIRQAIKNSWFNSKTQMKHLDDCQRLRREIDSSSSDNHWYVISLVRDCISRSISSYFHNQAQLNPGLLEEFRQGKVDLGKFTKQYFDTVGDIEDHTTWFNTQLKPVFGIDVFATPFHKEKGYSIYNRGNVSLLLIKMENLSECSSEAVSEFLGINKFKIFSDNLALEKSYYDAYKEFTNSIKFSLNDLERIYNFQMMRHFYSNNELNLFKQRWK